MTGGGRTQGVGNLLQAIVASNAIVWVVYVGPFVVNDEEGGGDTHGVPATDHG